jgi:hypothetical protein
MIPSSALCRAQEGLHRRRAADTSLENVRLVSTNAATAWAKEALAAECREARQLRSRATAEAASASHSDVVTQNDMQFSENPDRGFAIAKALS